MNSPEPNWDRIGEAVRRALIRQGAYFRSERRGFAPGHEQEDWLQAEREVNQLLAPRYAT